MSGRIKIAAIDFPFAGSWLHSFRSVPIVSGAKLVRFIVIETGACAATGRLPAYGMATRIATEAMTLSWIEHQTTNLGVGRSNRSGRASKIRHLQKITV
jgi:hypothetical protein